MKWDKGQSSDLVEDRRSERSRSRRESPEPERRPAKRTRQRRRSGKRKKLPRSGAAAGLGLVVAAIAVVVGVVRGGDDGDDKTAGAPADDTSSAAESKKSGTEEPENKSGDDSVTRDRELVDFLTFLVNDTNEFWEKTFEGKHRLKYKPAKMVIFDRPTSSKCGRRRARGGPVYCPNDQKMYIPPAFFRELREQHDAPGDFAQALVVAHEMGHHAQLGLGITKVVHHKKKDQRTRTGKLRWKRKQELQADCLAGVWARDVANRDRLEPGDVDEAVTAIAAIGDDTLQKNAGRKVDRSKFGHGSAAQRVRYFKKGFRRGELKDCLRELKSPYIK